MENDKKLHWENVYQSKQFTEVSWYQSIPQTSLDFIEKANLNKQSNIIDIGGGDSYLVDHLLKLEYQNITVLDISEKAILKAQKRLGSLSSKVNWIVADASNFIPPRKYDYWHDRAAFHFLTTQKEIDQYIDIASKYTTDSANLLVATFSKNGPTRCSGIEIQQYSEEVLTQKFSAHFIKKDCLVIDHITPSDKNQNFIFCSFTKKTN